MLRTFHDTSRHDGEPSSGCSAPRRAASARKPPQSLANRYSRGVPGHLSTARSSLNFAMTRLGQRVGFLLG